jgi:hypothetical protein
LSTILKTRSLFFTKHFLDISFPYFFSLRMYFHKMKFISDTSDLLTKHYKLFYIVRCITPVTGSFKDKSPEALSDFRSLTRLNKKKTTPHRVLILFLQKGYSNTNYYNIVHKKFYAHIVKLLLSAKFLLKSLNTP